MEHSPLLSHNLVVVIYYSGGETIQGLLLILHHYLVISFCMENWLKVKLAFVPILLKLCLALCLWHSIQFPGCESDVKYRQDTIMLQMCAILTLQPCHLAAISTQAPDNQLH